LFDGVLARGRVRAAVDDAAVLQAMLDAEAALARVEASSGLISGAAAAAITSASDARRYDVSALGSAAAASGNPVVPLVDALREAVGEDLGASVHHGATSQDILDTAMMLVTRRALQPLYADLAAASEAAARLAGAHIDTLMAGRTLLQQALPTTFGAKAAGWLVSLDEVDAMLRQRAREGLTVQLGGAAGTLAGLGDAGPAVLHAFALELELGEPVVPWHTDRVRVASIAATLGVVAGAIGKVALDVTLLAQTEVGEVAEGVPGRGGSSTLPHKRNPVAAVSALAATRRAPGLVATLLALMPQAHERAAGEWQAEWRPLLDLLEVVGSGAAWLLDCLTHLGVDADRMRANLGATGGRLLAERAVEGLAPLLGRGPARELVGRLATDDDLASRPLAELLLERSELASLAPATVRGWFDPEAYLGSARTFVTRAVEAHAAAVAGRAIA
jgi:3-carboxy-cis,cis-muconate cycloisomerase